MRFREGQSPVAAPRAALPTDPSARAAAIARGWDEAPVGRQRLNGCDSDPEDNVLTEWLVAQALLGRARAAAAGGAPPRADGELGCLQVDLDRAAAVSNLGHGAPIGVYIYKYLYLSIYIYIYI